VADLTTVYLGLGSNMGNRENNLEEALKLLGQRMQVGKISSIYDTAPLGNTNQPRFLNIACQVFTRLTPEGLLTLAKGIEQKMGRYGRSGEPRPIDIDILLYGDVVMDTRELKIPHPEMATREFVLVPLTEIAPEAVHPVTGKTVREMREAIKEKQGVLKWEKEGNGEKEGKADV
jgi:2-amino-4-hydroxy-6-hydroxymethyldihydropteridine diphosphokinase